MNGKGFLIGGLLIASAILAGGGTTAVAAVKVKCEIRASGGGETSSTNGCHVGTCPEVEELRKYSKKLTFVTGGDSGYKNYSDDHREGYFDYDGTESPNGVTRYKYLFTGINKAC